MGIICNFNNSPSHKNNVKNNQFLNFCSTDTHLENYSNNIIVYRSVMLITKYIKNFNILVECKEYSNSFFLSKLQIEKILNSPNPLQSGNKFLENLISSILLTGNAFIKIIKDCGIPNKLYILKSDKISVITCGDKVPIAYKYKTSSKEEYFYIDSVTGRGDILHIKYYNPIDSHLGISPLSIAAKSIELYNKFSNYSLSLLDKDLTKVNFNLYNEILKLKNNVAKEIAQAFGIPPILLGLQEDNIYKNLNDAKKVFLNETISPLVNYIITILNTWLKIYFGDEISLKFELNDTSEYIIH